MMLKTRFIVTLCALGALLWGSSLAAAAQAAPNITSPDEFFGFQLGTDRKLARWDKIVEYYQLLAKESDRIRVINMGPSTEGHPYLLAIISSPENIANLERIREVNLKLQDPRVAEPEIRQLIDEARQ